MRFVGTLKSWNDERGFGFLEPLRGGEDVFVHIKAFRVRAERPQVGQAMSFEVEPGPDRRTRAKNVEPIRLMRPRRLKPKESPTERATATALPLFVILCLVVGFLWQPPLIIAAVYVVASFVTFFVYAQDKSAARRNARRTPEVTLHFLAFAGGWPGALLAHHFLRHKSIKAEFRTVFWGTVVLNVLIFVFLCSPIGSLWASL